MFNKNNTLFIELKNSCNLKCKSCGYWKPHKISNISVKEFQEILAFFESIGIKKLHLTGGEPLLNNDVEAILNIAKNKNLYTKISTNGTLIRRNMSKKTLNMLDEIMISVDASNAILYKEIRGQDFFADVIDGIEYVSRQKKKTAIVLSFLIQRKNYKNILEFIRFASEYDIVRIAFLVPNKGGDFSGNVEKNCYRKEVFLSEEENKEWIEEIYPQLTENMKRYCHKIEFPNSKHMEAIRDYFSDGSLQIRKQPCMQAFNTIFVNADLEFKFCPYFEKTFKMGSFDIEHDLEKERLKILFDKKNQISKCAYCLETQLND